MKGSKDILARLLANENISVQYGPYPTAWFDVVQRTLGLPLWKETLLKDVQDLLIGHEVGHALFTPPEGWHDSVIAMDVPKAFINVIEDIRIERKIQTKYPGLVACFKRGYSELFKNNFFKTEGRNLSDYSLIDRINIKAKLRDLAEVKFSDEEAPLVNRAMSVETFDDVLASCAEIHAFMKMEKEDEQEEDPEENSPDNGEESEEFGDPLPGPGESESPEESEEEDESGPGNNPPKDKKEEKESEEEGSPSTGSEHSELSDEMDDIKVETDEAFRENEKSLITEGLDKTTYFNFPTRKEALLPFVSYKMLREGRIERNPHLLTDERLSSEFESFKTDTKKIVQLMVKEFELKKAASRHIRSQTNRSGALDTNKLYQYKLTDDIFKRFTTIPDAKSHGIVLLLDYSGSMGSCIKDVVEQLLTLVEFCKKTNIPFEVYSFTNRMTWTPDGRHELSFKDSNNVITDDFYLVNLISSSLSLSDYKEAYKGLFISSRKMSFSKYESMGNTPLDETLMAMTYLVKEFKEKLNLQKVTFVTLTDGAASQIRVAAPSAGWRSKHIFKYKNKTITTPMTKLTSVLLNIIRSEGINVIGFFLFDKKYDFISKVWGSSPNRNVPDSEMHTLWKKLAKDKVLALSNYPGYDQYFLLNSRNIKNSTEDFSINKDASVSQIQKAFKSHSASKKQNRVLANKFAQAIA